MKLAVLGGSAGVGLELVQQALERGHEVTTLSRSVASLPAHAALRIVQGSSTQPADVRRAIEGADAIAVTIGNGKNPRATRIFTDSWRTLDGVLRETGANPPLVILTGFGAGDSGAYHSPLNKLLFRFVLKDVYRNKTEMERAVAASRHRWVIVRAGRLTNGPLTGRYRVLPELERGMKVGAISRADTAHFMLAQAEHLTLPGRYPALTY